MKTAFRKSFTRDLKKVKDKDILDRVRKAIEDVEAADNVQEIGNLKKMSGTICFYRIRIGDYRIGISIEDEIVEFVRCLALGHGRHYNLVSAASPRGSGGLHLGFLRRMALFQRQPSRFNRIHGSDRPNH